MGHRRMEWVASTHYTTANHSLLSITINNKKHESYCLAAVRLVLGNKLKSQFQQHFPYLQGLKQNGLLT